MLKKIITSIKRLKGEKNKREKQLITRQILIQLLNHFDEKSLFGATLRAAYALAFAVFLRCGEFTYIAGQAVSSGFEQWHLIRNFIDIQADRMMISFPASKTDLFRRGITLTVTAVDDNACAVKAMKNLFTRFLRPPNAPLFHQQHGAFTREYVVSNLKPSMRVLGHEGNYSGHSFRRGAATSVKEAGLSDSDIQILGRWKSDAYRLYIDILLTHILEISRKFQQPHQ